MAREFAANLAPSYMRSLEGKTAVTYSSKFHFLSGKDATCGAGQYGGDESVGTLQCDEIEVTNPSGGAFVFRDD